MNNSFEELKDILLTEFRSSVDQINKTFLDKNGLDTRIYYSVKRTADFFDCTEEHARKLQSKIPCYKPGKEVYYKYTDLVAYMEASLKLPKLKSVQKNIEIATSCKRGVTRLSR